MRDDRDLIRQYLDQLRLSLRIPEAGRILVEAEDHLRDATAVGMAAGLTEAGAQQAAIASFGPVREIVYAHQTRHGRVAAVLADLAIALWRVAAFYLLTDFAIGLAGLLTTSWRILPLAAAIASPIVGVGTLILLTTTHLAPAPVPGIVAYAAVGLVIIYGWRMGRMLRNQARGQSELA